MLRSEHVATATKGEHSMNRRYVARRAKLPLPLVIAAAILTALVHVRAYADDSESGDPRIQRGLQAVPVPLNLQGRDVSMVGLGSYLVNVAAACNDCHSAGPATQYAAGANPFFGQPKIVNQATYLGGGNDFGPLVPGGTHIVSRNLTPDKTGRPEGGRTLAEFVHILETGEDLDHLHPPCSANVTQNCLPPPFDGNLLQIMPWPSFQRMTMHDMEAIYEYLSAIPCIAGPPAPSILHNDCP
jgi:hypothetical protein